MDHSAHVETYYWYCYTDKANLNHDRIRFFNLWRKYYYMYGK